MTRAFLISVVSCLIAINQAGPINRCDLAQVPPQEGMHGFEGCSLRDYKEFVEELFKKALQGREKDTSAKLTAELERAFSGRKVDSLPALLSLLIKLLSEQRELTVSKEEQDTNQWRNESSKAEKREAGGEQAPQESRELAAELPESGYHGRLVVAIPVIVGAIVSIVVFCFVAQDVSARRQPLWLRDLYRPCSARCIEDMAQTLHDKESSAEDELYYQMLRGEFAVLRVAATDSAA